MQKEIIDQITAMLGTYGWSAVLTTPDVLEISNSKGTFAGRLIHKKGKYKMELMTGVKVWSCNGNVVELFEKFIVKFFYLKKR